MNGYMGSYNKFIKRILDIFFSIIALPFFGIIFIVVAPMIKLEDGGRVFYNAPRLGKNGKPFKMYKFRSMKENAPDIRNEDGSTYNSKNDERVTKVGSLLRRTSIDEIPQLLNVIRGDMSWIGPRPDTLDDINRYTENQVIKLKARPGITGYSQAYYRNEIEQNCKFDNDAFYANNISFLLDLKIFVKTISTVTSRKKLYTNS